MKKYLALLILIPFLFAFTKKADVKNYYNLSDTLSFDGTLYSLSASYHPTDIYWKQEYLPQGENADHFGKMITIDFYMVDAPCKELMYKKVQELTDRKKNDPVVNFNLMENQSTGEAILDFVLSDSNGNSLNTVERNVYRYKNYTDNAGHKGILLFGISQRGYGNDIRPFFGRLKKNRIDDINKVAAYPMPKIQLQ